MPRKPAAHIAAVLAQTAARHQMPLTPAQIRVLAGATADELARPHPGAGADGRVLPGAVLAADQLEVLRLAANGAGTEQIASAQGRSVHAVKSQIQGILQRLGAIDRTQAVAVVMARGLLTPADIKLPEAKPRRKRARNSARKAAS